MWTRAELKERAKAALAQGYWKLVLVGVIASVVGGDIAVPQNLSFQKKRLQIYFRD